MISARRVMNLAVAFVCFSCAGNGNVKLYSAYSNDEGRTWSTAVQVSAGNNNSAQGFRETGQTAVSSDGLDSPCSSPA